LVPLIVRVLVEPTVTLSPVPASEIEAPVPNVTVALLMVRASPVPVTVMVLDALLLFRVKALLLPFSVRLGWAGVLAEPAFIVIVSPLPFTVT
jgi:hypothetical protein